MPVSRAKKLRALSAALVKQSTECVQLSKVIAERSKALKRTFKSHAAEKSK